MIAQYRKAIAAFLTPLSAYVLSLILGNPWRDGLDVLFAAIVTLATVFLVPNEAPAELPKVEERPMYDGH